MSVKFIFRGGKMLYENGQLVQYKKWIGEIEFAFDYNKTYSVTLFNYKNYGTVTKVIEQNLLVPYTEIEQLQIV